MIDLNQFTAHQKQTIIKMADCYLKQNGVKDAFDVVQIGITMDQSIKENIAAEAATVKNDEDKKTTEKKTKN